MSTRQATESPATEQLPELSPVAGSLLISLAFWFSLILASMLYAGVSLSPKLAEWLAVRDQHQANGLMLQTLEREADQLERLILAARQDPQFAAQLSRDGYGRRIASEDTTVPDAPKTSLSGPAFPNPAFLNAEGATEPSQGSIHPQYRRVIQQLAGDELLRRWLLYISATITILAFTLLNDAGRIAAVGSVHAVTTLCQSIASRYTKSHGSKSADMSNPILEPSDHEPPPAERGGRNS